MVQTVKEVREEMAKEPIPQFEMRHRLQLALEYGNVSVTEMAETLDASRTTVSNYLHGRTKPRRPDLAMWALKCGVPLEWLVTGHTVVEAMPVAGQGAKVRKKAAPRRAADG